ncbi:hypothetical protein B1694_19075 [Geobacillus zalihae]|nr:hypothetical protein I656_03431 [Geobacillus sp. WSUCF1]OQP15910.1 hypothetical protein B1694_19075 [Geobacillus zalihae]
MQEEKCHQKQEKLHLCSFPHQRGNRLKKRKSGYDEKRDVCRQPRICYKGWRRSFCLTFIDHSCMMKAYILIH